MIVYNTKGQAMPDRVVRLEENAFAPGAGTTVTWLGGAGVLVNARGTVLLLDSVLQDFDMPQLLEPPVTPAEIPAADACLITHIDGDHYSASTCRALVPACSAFHSTGYVAGEMRAAGIPGTGHDIGDAFRVGNVQATVTPVEHMWQNDLLENPGRVWMQEDCCGFWLSTPDGTVWLPGDSRLMEAHLRMPQPDVILFDFSDDSWHISLDGAVRLANTYPEARLLCIHWGTVDAPDALPFCPDPTPLFGRVVNPERLFVLRPGEPLYL